MISRKDLKKDLLEIFSALGNLQYQYNWVVTDHDMWYSENCPENVRKRWQWTGLLMSGQELTEHLRKMFVHFCCGAVLSAVPLGAKPEQVWNYEPHWEVDQFDSPKYQFQTPLTQMELICYDGYAWLIICKSEFSQMIQEKLPQAKKPADFYRALNNK